jgi:hypothetical protein
MSAKYRSWAHFLTGDESWFWLTIDSEQQCLPAGFERLTRPRKTVESPKPMIVIFWPPLGFSVIQTSPPKMTVTAVSFVDNIVPDIVAAKPVCDPCRRRVLHMDNASPHRAVLIAQRLEEKGIIANPLPAFSPDLGPSDFFLFGALKGQLTGHTFEWADGLIEEICEMMNAVPRAKLETVFLEWEEKLQRCITTWRLSRLHCNMISPTVPVPLGRC